MNTSSVSSLRRATKPCHINLDANESITPPMTTRPRKSSVDSLDEEYFSKTYVPLSNLPTPPLSSHSNASSCQQSPEALLSPTEFLDPELLGPAIHLTNLIPTSTSLTPASTSLVHALLSRASLSLETIALAVSILDSLNSRFALQWRKSCPLYTKEQAHVDSIHPELIALSALILAVKFLDDAQQSTIEYVESWGRGKWSCEQVNHTQWCLLDNLGGRLMPLWDEGVILGALEDMERAGRLATKGRALEEEWEEELDEENSLEGWTLVGKGEGTSVLGTSKLLAPLQTRTRENHQGATVEIGTPSTKRPQQDSKPAERKAAGEPFPLFIDPSTGLGF